MTKEVFSSLYNLIRKHDWLSLYERDQALYSLLFNDCKSEPERALLSILINNIESFNDRRLSSCLRNIVKNISESHQFSVENTLILPLTPDRDIDSGQYILYGMKPYLEEFKISEIKTANRYTYCREIIKKDDKIEHIVLVDEFLGSGKTLLSRYKTILGWLTELKKEMVTITAHFVAAQKVGLELAKEKGISVRAEVLLLRGISDNAQLDVTASLENMKKLENALSSNYKGRNLPSLGYGEAESLYHREGGNTPNSVFPIFWWKYYKNGEVRPTILIRNMKDA